MENSVCVTACTGPYYDSGTITCGACHVSCYNCTAGTASDCILCAYGLTKVSGSGNCVACDSTTCLSCYNSTTGCRVCKVGYYRTFEHNSIGSPTNTLGVATCATCDSSCSSGPCRGPAASDCLAWEIIKYLYNQTYLFYDMM